MTDEDVESLAEGIIESLEIRSLPIPLSDIADAEGIKLLPGQYGMCFDSRIEFRRREGGGQFYLFYVGEDDVAWGRGRTRFSIAHELGHFYIPEHRAFLLSGRWHGSHVGFVSDKGIEREADKFAAALLMPRESFIREFNLRWNGSGCTLRDLSFLGDSVFGTSLSSTAIRYAQLDFEPSCVVLSRGDRVVFSRASVSMKARGLGWIDPGQGLPVGSVTGRLLRNALGRDPREVEEGLVPTDVWFNRAAPVDLWEEALILGRTGLTLTFLVFAEDPDEGD